MRLTQRAEKIFTSLEQLCALAAKMQKNQPCKKDDLDPNWKLVRELADPNYGHKVLTVIEKAVAEANKILVSYGSYGEKKAERKQRQPGKPGPGTNPGNRRLLEKNAKAARVACVEPALSIGPPRPGSIG